MPVVMVLDDGGRLEVAMGGGDFRENYKLE